MTPFRPVTERHHDTEPTRQTWAEEGSYEQSRQGREVLSGAVVPDVDNDAIRVIRG